MIQTVSEFLVDALLGNVPDDVSFQLGEIGEDDINEFRGEIETFTANQLPLLAVRCHAINEMARRNVETFELFRVKTQVAK